MTIQDGGIVMRHYAFLGAALIGSVLALGCGTDRIDVQHAHANGAGLVKTYDVGFDTAWQAAHAALRWSGAGTPQDHLDQHYVVTNDPSSAASSYGQQVGIWLEPLAATQTRVNVVVLEPTTTSDTGGPDERGVQKDIEKAVSMIVSGQAIPDKRP
jgi:hypothetical protein